MEDGLIMDNGFNQMDNGFNQMNNAPVQPDPTMQQPYVQPNAEQGFVQPDYNAGQAYAQPSYDGYPNQQVSGWNNYPTNNFQPANQFAESEPSVVKCPGKEITGMVFGISALLMGLIAILMGFIGIGIGAVYGRHSAYNLYTRAMATTSSQVFVYGFIYSFLGIAFAIVAMVMLSKVYAVAQEITNKIKAGFGMAIAGIITSGLGLILTIIGILVMTL